MLITAVIAMLVMVPSLAKGPRYSPGQPWDAEAEWFGAPEQRPTIPSPQDRLALESSGRESPPEGAEQSTGSTIVAGDRGATGSTEPTAGDADTGGASVRW